MVSRANCYHCLLLRLLREQGLNHFKALSFFYPSIREVIYRRNLKEEGPIHQEGRQARRRGPARPTEAAAAPQPHSHPLLGLVPTFPQSSTKSQRPRAGRPSLWEAAMPAAGGPRARGTPPFSPQPDAPLTGGKHSAPPSC